MIHDNENNGGKQINVKKRQKTLVSNSTNYVNRN